MATYTKAIRIDDQVDTSRTTTGTLLATLASDEFFVGKVARRNQSDAVEVEISGSAGDNLAVKFAASGADARFSDIIFVGPSQGVELASISGISAECHLTGVIFKNTA